jgi:hypothetical protein
MPHGIGEEQGTAGRVTNERQLRRRIHHRPVSRQIGLTGQHVHGLRAGDARHQFHCQRGNARFGFGRQPVAVGIRVQDADQHGAALHQREFVASFGGGRRMPHLQHDIGVGIGGSGVRSDLRTGIGRPCPGSRRRRRPRSRQPSPAPDPCTSSPCPAMPRPGARSFGVPSIWPFSWWNTFGVLFRGSTFRSLPRSVPASCQPWSDPIVKGFPQGSEG